MTVLSSPQTATPMLLKAGGSLFELAAKLVGIDAMFRYLVGSNENYWNVDAVARGQVRVFVDVDLTENRVEFLE